MKVPVVDIEIYIGPPRKEPLLVAAAAAEALTALQGESVPSKHVKQAIAALQRVLEVQAVPTQRAPR